MTRKQAVEILHATHPHQRGDRAGDWRRGALELLDALDRAGAFPSEATDPGGEKLRRAINALETIARGESWNPRETARFYLNSVKS